MVSKGIELINEDSGRREGKTALSHRWNHIFWEFGVAGGPFSEHVLSCLGGPWPSELLPTVPAGDRTAFGL